jgi:hypothetical protein
MKITLIKECDIPITAKLLKDAEDIFDEELK